tara:strand:+ start:658 stop:1104 length:447 start_codon:yes stop_codon:yes gene_type:complete
MSKSGQASFEYLAVLALTLLILVPAIYLFFSYSRDSKEDIIDANVNKIGREMVDIVNYVYYSGEGSKITLEVDIPSDVKEIKVDDNFKEIIFVLDTGKGDNEMVFFTKVAADVVMAPLLNPLGKMDLEVNFELDAPAPASDIISIIPK